jgi:uncharacterized protein (DUF2235 family)
MGKNIVICLDGTWNKPDEPEEEVSTETNVRCLYEICAQKEGQQIAYYDEGVGSHWYDRIRGGIFGSGLSKNIREGYYFICTHYEKDDRVYIFGFSRGAYTARSLGGLIYSCGLLPEGKLTEKNIDAVYDLYKNGEKDERSQCKENNITCPIEMIGVWDTVGALGIPTLLLGKITDKLLQFHDTKLNREVKAAYHALAIDEQREKFAPTLWDVTYNTERSGQILEQVWFAGVHSDVGGGYNERFHSDSAFRWMAEKAFKHGMVIDQSKYSFQPDPAQPIHDSYKVYFGPKERRVATVSEVHVPKVHRSVLEKMQKDSSYRPLALVDMEDRGSLEPYNVVE